MCMCYNGVCVCVYVCVLPVEMPVLVGEVGVVDFSRGNLLNILLAPAIKQNISYSIYKELRSHLRSCSL